MALVRNKAFYRKAALLALPVVVQNMITIGVNMLDTIMLGRFGEIQLSASSLANSFISIFQILCMGIGGGAAVLTAQLWGAEDVSGIRKVYALMTRICVIISLLFTAAVLLIPKEIMTLYTNEAGIIDYGVLYFRLSALTFLLMGISTTTTIILRSIHEVRFTLLTSIISFVSNLFFNWVLIFGQFGLPRMEIAGAAVATVIARLIETAVIVVYVFLKDKKIRMRIRNLFEPCGEFLQPYLRYSVPVIISDFLLGLGNTAVSIIIGHLGAAFVSANAIVALIVRLSTVMSQGLANAGSIMTGHAIGRGEKKLAHDQGVTFLLLSALLGVIASGIILLSAPAILSTYNITEETMKIARALILSVSIMVIFQTTQSMLTKGVLRGGGDTRFLMFADIAFMWICSIPLGYYSAFVWHLSPFWIYLIMKIDYLIKTLICAWRLKGEKWMRIVAKEGEGV